MSIGVTRRKLLGSAAHASLLLMTLPAAAQTIESMKAAPEAPSAEAEIVVTGSLISRPDLKVASPITVIGQQEISLRQASTAEELLRDLPSVRPSLGPNVNAGDDRAATIELRGIEARRTLVLLDSRRIVPFGLDGIVDTNVIPTAMIERVDVVTGGASSIYGADAVAGVVNFVTKRNFSGVDASANYRITERGDGADYRASLTLGTNFAGGRGNVVASIGYHDRQPIEVGSRSVAPFVISSSTGQFSGATAAGVTIFTSPSNAAFGLPPSSIGAVVDPTTGLLRAATPTDTFNGYDGIYFQTALKQVNGYAAARYEVSDALEFYSSGLFASNDSSAQQAPSGTFNSTFRLPLNNAYLPAGIRNQLCAGFDTNPAVVGVQPISAGQCAAAATAQGPSSPGYLEIPVIAQRRFTEYGRRGNNVDASAYQVQFGIRGKLSPSLRYNISGQHGESRQTLTRVNWGSYSKVQQALRSFRDGQGVAVCSDGSNGCVPLNLFGPNGSITSDQIAFFDLDAVIKRKVKQDVVTATIDGDLFGVVSPFATSPVAFSIGAEYRRISAESLPDAASAIQGEVLGTGSRTPADFGQYSSKEVFGELIVPLVADVRGIRSLQAEGGVRYSDYTTTGGSLTWKAGGSYEPVDGVKFRGMYQVAVRSPNIQELFQSTVTTLANLNPDPCQGSQLPNAGANPSLAALCIATGAPAGSIGSIPAPTTGQINATTSGNRNLDVERAKTYTLGLVLTPTMLPRFSATIDYFNIKVSDAISFPATGDILNGCYSASLNPGQQVNAFCQLIKRNPLTGSLNGGAETLGVILAGSNLGTIETAGIDVGVSYRIPLSFGVVDNSSTVAFSFNGTYLDHYRFQATPNSINRDCTGYYSLNCTNPRARYKWNSRVTYSSGPFTASLLWNHIGGVKLEPFQATVTTPISTPQPGGPNPSTVLEAFRRISARDYFDLSLRADVSKRFELTLTIDNLLDKDPPLVGSNVGGSAFNNGNTFPTIYDPLGRSYTIGARVKF